MSLTHFLLRCGLIDRVVKPTRDHSIVRRWMAAGRPSPPPHAVKAAAVLLLADLHGLDLLVETGTHYGRMIRALAPRFRAIYSIELSPRLAAIAAKEFARYRHVRIIEGDSASCLPQLLTRLKEPALFWLDAHFCSGDSVRGDVDSPIKIELSTIIFHAPKGSVILVDDARHFCGSSGYPVLESFKAELGRRTGNAVTVRRHDLRRPVANFGRARIPGGDAAVTARLDRLYAARDRHCGRGRKTPVNAVQGATW